MPLEPKIRKESYQFFLEEAPELLQSMEQELLCLQENFSLNQINNLMRLTHTLKGAAASVELDTIRNVAHSLEDIFRALCRPSVTLNAEIEALLLEGFECLRQPLVAELTQTPVNATEVLDRAASIFAQLQDQLGDIFGQETELPTSLELGFDITQSIFETGVNERLEQLENTLASGKVSALSLLLQEQAEVFQGLAESLHLPGLGNIAAAISQALARNPNQVLEIATIALQDLRASQAAILTGDRQQGGTPSEPLLSFSQGPFAGNNLQPSAQNYGAVPPRSDAETTPWIHQVHDEQAMLNLFKSNGQGASPEQLIPPNQTGERPVIPRLSWETETVAPPPQAPNHADQPQDMLITRSPILRGLNYLWKQVIQPELQAWSHFDRDAQAAETESTPPNQVLSFHPFADAPNTPEIRPNIDAQSEIPPSIALEVISAVKPLGTDFTPEPPLESSNNAQPFALPRQSATDQSLNQNGNHRPSRTADPDLTEQQSSSPSPEMIPAISIVRVNVEHLDHLNYTVGELLMTQNRQALQSERMQASVKELQNRLQQHQHLLNQLSDSGQLISIKHLDADRSSVLAPYKTSLENNFDILELDRYDESQLAIQEILDGMVQLSESTEALHLFSQEIEQNIGKQQRLLTNTRDALIEVRMIPLDGIFNRLSPVLKQLEKRHKKQINFLFSGNHIQIDKSIAEQLYSALLHMVRNAFDHGIESSEIRQERGKSTQGKITISANYEGQNLIVKVQDDGEGLKLNSIREKAISQKIISFEKAHSLAREQLIDLLFIPGFSTASHLSDLSGRGVGLDVVKAQVERLQGQVEVFSEAEKGTCFSLKIPRSLTITKVLLVAAGDKTYGITLDAIQQIVLPKPEQVRDWGNQQALRWQKDGDEHLLSIFSLSLGLHYSQEPNAHDFKATETQAHSTKPILLIECDEKLVGLAIDQLIGEKELVIYPLSSVITPPSYLYGGSTLPDGKLALVLDAAALGKTLKERGQQSIDANLTRAQPQWSGPTPEQQVSQHQIEAIQPISRVLAPAPSAGNSDRESLIKSWFAEPQKNTILVVDDSITVRQTLAMMLQRSGYNTVQAKDGYDALEKLASNPNIQTVICDIEMPRMNGFEFLKQKHKNPDFNTIPVIMLTSRSGDKHRHLTYELGASAYLTKPYLEHQILEALQRAFKYEQINSPVLLQNTT